jgi:uncharacterized metal-binding protein
MSCPHKIAMGSIGTCEQCKQTANWDAAQAETDRLRKQVEELEGLLTLNTNGRIVKEFEADRYRTALEEIVFECKMGVNYQCIVEDVSSIADAALNPCDPTE